MATVNHRVINTNGINMHIAEQARDRWSSSVMGLQSCGTHGDISCRHWRRPATTWWPQTSAATGKPTVRRHRGV